MKDRILKLYRRYREVVNYVFFGGLTTLVNIAGYALLRKLGVPSDPATWTATAVSILFAYFTNRRWVFESRTAGKAAWREFGSFVACRISTLLLDAGIMYLCVTLPRRGEDMAWCMLVKIATNVIVIVINYVFSKLFIFKQKS